ncbi:hypothetical protein CAPTEDRAFT_198999 [Capitella teleta]|uniref:Uncharacterized protein n=1 Tax=Capitella teleta TaxID=283909 RepID=R7TXS4_CAPTE|nr:hypothetical protein CAPTEDRAFT_198999 [Capitella teleta]|eukprot:ELT95765.1 hypothetical protein CAPTEDRAFT_198999 [Capitella teleta]
MDIIEVNSKNPEPLHVKHDVACQGLMTRSQASSNTKRAQSGDTKTPLFLSPSTIAVWQTVASNVALFLGSDRSVANQTGQQFRSTKKYFISLIQMPLNVAICALERPRATLRPRGPDLAPGPEFGDPVIQLH